MDRDRMIVRVEFSNICRERANTIRAQVEVKIVFFAKVPLKCIVVAEPGDHFAII